MEIPNVLLIRNGFSEDGRKYINRCCACEEQEFLLVVFDDAGVLCERCLKEGLSLIEKFKGMEKKHETELETIDSWNYIDAGIFRGLG